jgi:hypothetical protein
MSKYIILVKNSGGYHTDLVEHSTIEDAVEDIAARHGITSIVAMAKVFGDGSSGPFKTVRSTPRPKYELDKNWEPQ